MEKKPRRFTKIPVFIVEEHNDVLHFVYRCLGSRHLPFEGNTLVHFDAHPDLTVPMKLPSTAICDKEKLLPSLSIENWIMPTCFAGHVSRIFWIRQDWAQQIPPGRHDFTVGEHNGHIHVDSELEYFISEGSFAPIECLKSQKSIELHVGTVEEILCGDVRPENFILDIDLDYFSTHNPFLNLHSEVNLYERLREIYSYTLDKTDLVTTVDRRVAQLDFLEGIFMHLQQSGNLEDFPAKDHPLFEPVKRLSDDISEKCTSSATIDWEIIHSAGCTLDTTQLPHHEATDAELRDSLATLKSFLMCHPPPTIITISRSTDDDYCPAHQVEDIQTALLDTLRDIYSESLAEPQLFYKED
ncbi:UPF0489 protein C5orf22 homolog [Phlebotomus argentipes]|uniref:UPF0489 protein C5orf22 homolog n=1 Tax=Phlebotomus argentipes TaxID=94469 RepID=UPI0028934173|nr:UPF0489 protein C5orf22 homolog [Phlebotomus argentipes]